MSSETRSPAKSRDRFASIWARIGFANGLLGRLAGDAVGRKAYGEPEPKLAEVQQELRADRQRRLDMRIKASPVFVLAPDEQLGKIMYGMVNARGNQAMNADRRSEQLIAWAGDSKERMSLLKEYCKAVLEGDFALNQYSREAIQKLARED